MHIVVVESSLMMIRIIEQMLKDDGDRVTSFTDGREALEFIQSEPGIDVVMTSLNIGSVSGLELCWEARLLAQNGRPIYVIAMSSPEEQHKLIEVLDSGADEFIQKPPAKGELMARLRAAQRLLSMQKQLVTMANIDPLTGLRNRRAFFNEAVGLFGVATAVSPMSAVMFDIDHFKRINDTYGHDAGDEVLRQLAMFVRNEDTICGRLGGEEFAMLAPHCDEDSAVQIADNLRLRIGANPMVSEDRRIHVTCSFGVSGHAEGETIDALLKKADQALYSAKRAGRNRVVSNSDLMKLGDTSEEMKDHLYRSGVR